MSKHGGYFLYQKGRKSKNWYYEISRAFTGGKRVRGSCGTDDKEKALIIAAKKAEEYFGSTYLAKKPEITMDEAAAKYWIEHAIYQKGAKGIKYRIYYLLDYFGKETKLSKLSTATVRGYVNFRRLARVKNASKERSRKEGLKEQKIISPASINRELAVLRRICRLAEREWKVAVGEVNFSDLVLLEEDKHLTHYTREEVYRIINAARSHDDTKHIADIIEFAFLTGQRISNVLSCTWEQVYLETVPPIIRFRVKSRKREGKALDFHIHAQLRELLERIGISMSGYLFPDRNSYRGRNRGEGEEKPFSAIYKSFVSSVKRAGLPVPPPGQKLHVLRHSFIMHLLNEGVPAHVVQKIVGHSNINTTMRYVTVRGVTEKSSLDRAFGHDLVTPARDRGIHVIAKH